MATTRTTIRTTVLAFTEPNTLIQGTGHVAFPPRPCGAGNTSTAALPAVCDVTTRLQHASDEVEAPPRPITACEVGTRRALSTDPLTADSRGPAAITQSSPIAAALFGGAVAGGGTAWVRIRCSPTCTQECLINQLNHEGSDQAFGFNKSILNLVHVIYFSIKEGIK